MEFRVGDSVEIDVDWGSGLHKRKRCEIVYFQQHGRQKCARIDWISKRFGKKLAQEYGTLFTIEELRKWEK